ncbi:MAG: hypothetical protein AAGA05_11205 [Pseudomonadota bacterium]
MSNMTPNTFGLRLVICGALLTGLGACGGGGGAGTMEDIVASFGTVFQQAFNQGLNDTPVDVANSGLQVQLMQDPVEL